MRCTLTIALAALVFTACGGGASPTTAPAAGASATKAPVAAASPAGAPSAAAASLAPAGGDKNPACALLTTDEAATLLGGPVTETRPGEAGEEGAGCAFYAGAYPNYTGILIVALEYPPGAKARFDVNKVNKPGVKVVSGLGDEAWGQNISGTGLAHVVGIKGDKVVGIELQVPAPPNTVPPPIPDATFTILQGLVAKALTRI